MSVLRRLRSAVTTLREDIATAIRHDPAARGPLEVALTYPGVHAVWAHRAAHALWKRELVLPARAVAHLNRFVTGVEIHPGAHLGRRVFIDHGMGVVIGETARVGDGCLLYAGVVLGGTSLEKGPRHPELGRDVVVGSHACVLGHITVGEGARIGSGSVVVRAVPPGATVVGVPGRITLANDRRTRFESTLDHSSLPDPVADMIRSLAAQNERLRRRLEALEQAAGITSSRDDDADEADGGDAGHPPVTHGG